MLTRRGFVGTGVLGLAALATPTELLAHRPLPSFPSKPEDDYDLLAKLHYNENPYGPPPSVLQAMTKAHKYANRYGYPDGGIVEAIAKHHGIDQKYILLGAGSSEILDVVGSAFASNGKKVVGVEPSYSFVYSHVASVQGTPLTIPLTSDYRQDIPALVRLTKKHYRDVGFVYICNPNNPTGRIVTKREIKELVDGVPEDIPILIDEAYHHFVEDPEYATSIPYVAEGRPVIVARTFSKIAGLAGMRLGYGIAQPELIRKMNPYVTDAINAVVKHAGAAALKDTEAQAHVKRVTLQLRKLTTDELRTLGYDVIPSEANFFMVHLKRPVAPVIAAFEKRAILVGRPFPPMMQHLRVSVGTADEMKRFMVAFKDIMSKRDA
jgi:histidinol-phosphate aminotransferase